MLGNLKSMGLLDTTKDSPTHNASSGPAEKPSESDGWHGNPAQNWFQVAVILFWLEGWKGNSDV